MVQAKSMDLVGAIFWPLEAKVIWLELAIRLALVGLYVLTKMTKPYTLEVSNPEDWYYYAHPVTANPMIPGVTLYNLVCMYSLLSGALGLLYARVMLRVDGRALLSSFMFYCLAASLALTLTAVSTNVLKIFGGRMRPDYLNRCLPSMFLRDRVPHFNMFDIHGQVLPPFDQSKLDCEPTSEYDVLDGSKSFPSGHSSYAASVASVAAVYLNKIVERTPRPRLVVKSSLVVLISLACVAFPVVVGITRVLDRRHHPSDVLAGLCLGAFNGFLVSGLYFAEPFAIPQKSEFSAQQAKLNPEASLETTPDKSGAAAISRTLLQTC